MEQAMQLLDRAFGTLSIVLIAASQADKVSSVQTDLRQAYTILQQLLSMRQEAEMQAKEKREARKKAKEKREARKKAKAESTVITDKAPSVERPFGKEVEVHG